MTLREGASRTAGAGSDGTSGVSQGIGYKEFLPHLDGSATLEECVERTKAATRRYAKRQHLAKVLFGYILYVDANPLQALELATHAHERAGAKDWWWKVQIGKCYYLVGLLRDAQARAPPPPPPAPCPPSPGSRRSGTTPWWSWRGAARIPCMTEHTGVGHSLQCSCASGWCL